MFSMRLFDKAHGRCVRVTNPNLAGQYRLLYPDGASVSADGKFAEEAPTSKVERLRLRFAYVVSMMEVEESDWMRFRNNCEMQAGMQRYTNAPEVEVESMVDDLKRGKARIEKLRAEALALKRELDELSGDAEKREELAAEEERRATLAREIRENIRSVTLPNFFPT